MRTSSLPSPHHPRLIAAASTWLLGGGVLLLSTLVPAHTPLLGWTPAFWLLAAPLLVLLALLRLRRVKLKQALATQRRLLRSESRQRKRMQCGEAGAGESAAEIRRRLARERRMNPTSQTTQRTQRTALTRRE